GLPVHAVVCTQNGQCAEMPSSFSFSWANAALTSRADIRPAAFCTRKLEGCAPAAPDFLANARNCDNVFAPCCAPSSEGWKRVRAMIAEISRFGRKFQVPSSKLQNRQVGRAL